VKRVLFGLALTLLCGAAVPQNQNQPQQSWLNLLYPPKQGTQPSGPILLWPGGMGVFDCVGTWGGATVTLEYQGADELTMLAAGTATTLTANGGGVFYLPPVNIQAVVSGAGSTTSLYCSAGEVPSPNSA
jgi:hypothetical protein